MPHLSVLLVALDVFLPRLQAQLPCEVPHLFVFPSPFLSDGLRSLSALSALPAQPPCEVPHLSVLLVARVAFLSRLRAQLPCEVPHLSVLLVALDVFLPRLRA